MLVFFYSYPPRIPSSFEIRVIMCWADSTFL